MIKLFLRRMPSIELFTSFWSPTKCSMCYWWRLSIIALVCFGIGQISENAQLIFAFCLFFIGVFYGVRIDQKVSEQGDTDD